MPHIFENVNPTKYYITLRHHVKSYIKSFKDIQHHIYCVRFIHMVHGPVKDWE